MIPEHPTLRRPNPRGSRLKESREQEIIAQVGETARRQGVDPARFLTLYVALKSKPLLIVRGPGRSGKLAAVQALARLLTGGAHAQLQEMIGHPWWAAGCHDKGLLAEAQSRFNVGKVQAMLEEASCPGNGHRLFIAFLMRVSPAEVDGIFADLASQVAMGYVSDPWDTEVERQVSFPPNFLMAGTLDTNCAFGWQEPTLRCTAVVPWPPSGPAPTTTIHDGPDQAGRPGPAFLGTRMRSERDAALRLRRISGWRPQWLRPLFEIVGALQDTGLRLPQGIFGEALVFIANSFTEGGAGVFENTPRENAATALDAAFSAILLPRIESYLSRSCLEPERLGPLLARDFPTSAAVLARREPQPGGTTPQRGLDSMRIGR